MNFNSSPLELLDLSLFGVQNEVYIKRDDLIHPIVSGNKWRKLKENFSFYKSSNYKGIVSLGGAYSSHILSLSFICSQEKIPCALIIRGEEPKEKNGILKQCLEYGATLNFVTRSQYANQDWIKRYVLKNHSSFFFIPEGGANKQGIEGCREIINELSIDFDEIYCEVGTGATLAGLSLALKEYQTVKGIVVLKGANNIDQEISRNFLLNNGSEIANNWNLIHDYHFGGYAKYNADLIDFMREFYLKTGIKTDPIYSGKLFYGLIDQLTKQKNPLNKRIVALHSGGLTGNKGFEKRYGLKIFN